nr:MAG TPA: hypothetical protein [Microviridae sp.]
MGDILGGVAAGASAGGAIGSYFLANLFILLYIYYG